MYCLLWIRRTVKRWFRFKPSKQKLVQLWAIASTVLLFLSLFCLWRALDTINRFEHAELQSYSKRGKQISVTLPSDRSYLLSFGKKDVKIDHCIGSSRQDALDMVSFVKGYAAEQKIEIPRSASSSLIERLILGWAIRRVSAALLSEPSLATSTAYFICKIFKTTPPIRILDSFFIII